MPRAQAPHEGNKLRSDECVTCPEHDTQAMAAAAIMTMALLTEGFPHPHDRIRGDASRVLASPTSPPPVWDPCPHSDTGQVGTCTLPSPPEAERARGPGQGRQAIGSRHETRTLDSRGPGCTKPNPASTPGLAARSSLSAPPGARPPLGASGGLSRGRLGEGTQKRG